MSGEGLSVEAERAGCRGWGLGGVTVPREGLAPLQGSLCTRLQSPALGPLRGRGAHPAGKGRTPKVIVGRWIRQLCPIAKQVSEIVWDKHLTNAPLLPWGLVQLVTHKSPGIVRAAGPCPKGRLWGSYPVSPCPSSHPVLLCHATPRHPGLAAAPAVLRDGQGQAAGTP